MSKVKKISEAKSGEHAPTKQEERRFALCERLRALSIEAHPATIGENIVITDSAAKLVLDIVDAAQGRKLRMFRVTRKQSCEADPSKREGYYIEAMTPLEAAEKLKKHRYQTDTAGFTVQSWEHVGEFAHGAVLGEFFGPESEG